MPELPLKVALVALNQPGYQSLALGYLRAYAEAHDRLRGKAVFQTLELSCELDPWWIAYRVLRMAPDVVAFSVYCWNAASVYTACGIIGAASPRTVIVLGGPEVGPIADDVLARHRAVDMVVRGEGEETFAQLLLFLATGKRPWMCKGVTARREDEIVSAADRPVIEDLDTIPSPYLTGTLRPTSTTAYLETYRGCPHRCAYCFEAKGETGIRSFSQERVHAEIEALAASGLATFSFIDSVFNLTPGRLEWLADLLEPHARRGLRLHTIEIDIERIDDAQAAELVRAGVVSVETGPQSIGAQALTTSMRTFDPERFVSGMSALRNAGITVECDVIIGLPGDDPFDVMAGLRWLIELDPGIVQSSTLRVLPGTALSRQADELGLAFDTEPDHTVVSTPGLSFSDIRRLEAMASAAQSAYSARL